MLIATLYWPTSPTLAESACGSPIQPFEATYTVSRNNKPMGIAVARLERNDDRWQYQLSTDAQHGLAAFLNASVYERTYFEWHRQRPRTLQYEYLQKVSFRKRQHDAHFDWQQGFASGEHRGDRWQLPLRAEHTDRLLINLLLMQDLTARRDHMSYTTIDKGDVRLLKFRRLGEATIQSALGTLETEIVVREHRNAARQSQAWHAPALDFLPVRLQQIDEDDDEIISMEISALTILNCQSIQGNTRYP